MTRPPANASWAASQEAASCMVSGLASRLTLGTATNSASSRRYPASPGACLSTSAVDRDDLAGDPGRRRRGEEPDAVGDVGGIAQAPHGDARHQRPLPVRAVAPPLLLGGRVGPDEAGRDA